MTLISSIIPIRTDNFSFYAERLRMRESIHLANIETIVIDDGSPDDIGEKIKELCENLGFLYKKINSIHLPFSLSRARNVGIDLATSEWLIMEDADIVYQFDFYEKILKEVDVIDETPFNFLTIPVVYLKENISLDVFEAGSIDKFVPKILSRVQFESLVNNSENEVVESYAPATALFIVRKKLINLVGGYDEYFVGWGGEDRDIAFRMLAVNKKLDFSPTSFDVTKAWSLNQTYDYEGWRSLYRLTGDYLANKGLYGFHLYHPKLEWREKSDTSKNINFAKEKAVVCYKNKKLRTRYSIDKPVQIVIGYNPYLINDYVLNIFDNLLILDDDRNKPYQQTLEKIKNIPDVDCIVFWNSYGTQWKMDLYLSLKELGYKTIVAERGALPNSYYFDTNGFCIESESYKNYVEIVEINKKDYLDKRGAILDYIDNLRFGSDALEKQADRISVGLLKLRLNIEEGKKILFCPLQLSTDTVTNYYLEANRSYDDYLNEIMKLSSNLPEDWVLVIKNHPLSKEKFNNPNVIVVDNYHIHDLLEACDSVVLFNSGCGVLSMAFDKKVFYYGKCFYAIDGVNTKFESSIQLCEELGKPNLNIDFNKVLKFYYFLIYHFYSFAIVQNEVINKNGVKGNQLKSIDYISINFPDKNTISYNSPTLLKKHSLLLERYGKSLYLQRMAKQVKTPAKVSQAELVKKNDTSERKTLPLKLYILLASPFMNEKKKNKLINDPKSFVNDTSNWFLKKMEHFLIKS